jgi:hypothetical protein
MEPITWRKLLKFIILYSERIGDSEFDFLQEEFLRKRHQVEKAQDIKEN